jgi:hypothetical protein
MVSDKVFVNGDAFMWDAVACFAQHAAPCREQRRAFHKFHMVFFLTYGGWKFCFVRFARCTGCVWRESLKFRQWGCRFSLQSLRFD